MDHLYKPATPSFAAMHWKAWKTPLYWWIVPGTYHKNRTKQSLFWFLEIVRYQQKFKTYQWHMKACNIFRPIKLYMIYYLQFDKTQVSFKIPLWRWKIYEENDQSRPVFEVGFSLHQKEWWKKLQLIQQHLQWQAAYDNTLGWRRKTSCHESLDHNDKVCQSCSFYKFTYKTQIWRLLAWNTAASSTT